MGHSSQTSALGIFQIKWRKSYIFAVLIDKRERKESPSLPAGSPPGAQPFRSRKNCWISRVAEYGIKFRKESVDFRPRLEPFCNQRRAAAGIRHGGQAICSCVHVSCFETVLFEA